MRKAIGIFFIKLGIRIIKPELLETGLVAYTLLTLEEDSE